MQFFTSAWSLIRSCLTIVHDIIKIIWKKTEKDVSDNYDDIKDERDPFKTAYTLRVNDKNIRERRRQVEAALTPDELRKLNNLV